MDRYYVLAPLGQAIRRCIQHTGLPRVFWKLQSLREQYDELSDEAIENIADEDTDLGSIRNRMLHYEDYDQIDRDESPEYGDWL